MTEKLENGRVAWFMSRVLRLMNNEEAYDCTDWLWLWEDGCDFETALDTYEDDEAFDELKYAYLDIFKDYYQDGWYKLNLQPDRDLIIDMINKTKEELKIKGELKETQSNFYEII